MKLGGKIVRWFDEWQMAASGIVLATRKRKFWLGFGLSFAVFATLMQMLSDGAATFGLFWISNFVGKLRILGESFLANFGVGRSFLDWLIIFSITLLQSILIGLIVVLWRKPTQKRKILKNRHKYKTSADQAGISHAQQNSENVQSVGIVAGLALLGSGCPTCGTTILAPVLATFVNIGGLTFVSTVSILFTGISLIISIFILHRLGRDVYIRVKSEEFERKKGAKWKII